MLVSDAEVNGIVARLLNEDCHLRSLLIASRSMNLKRSKRLVCGHQMGLRTDVRGRNYRNVFETS